MTFIDERGRVFGRLNVIDAVLVFVVIGLVPLAYGSYLLFRTPPPRLTAVEPQTLALEPSPVLPQRIVVRGENLRPYMRVSFGDYQGRSFLFESPTQAVIELNPMPPGTYDVALYDYAQERARLPRAFTLAASKLPATNVLVIGRIVNVVEDKASEIVAGLKQTQYGAVVRAGRPRLQSTRVHSGVSTIDLPAKGVYQVPAILQIPCEVLMNGGLPNCIINGVGLAADGILQLNTALGVFNFQVDQVLSAAPLVAVDAVIHLAGAPAVVEFVRDGDIDIGTSRNELTAGARVTSTASVAGGRNVTLQVQAQKSADGWWYQGAPLRAGGEFVLRTNNYELSGTILRLTPQAQP
jgi:hypothetical protein